MSEIKDGRTIAQWVLVASLVGDFRVAIPQDVGWFDPNPVTQRPFLK